jgi:hypothetical protein
MTMNHPATTMTADEWAEHARLLRNSNALLRTRLWSQYADVRRETAAEIEVAASIIAWIEAPATPVGPATWRSHARACRRTAEAMRRIDNHMRPIVERSGVPFVLVPYGMRLEAVVDPRERGE